MMMVGVLIKVHPVILAQRIDARFEHQGLEAGAFYLPMWGRDIFVSYPGFVAQHGQSKEELIVPEQALVIYHFVTTNGTPETRQWISFTDLPDGRFYSQAFQGYTGQELARMFDSDHERFEAAALISSGKPHDLGAVSYEFQLFPRVPLLVVMWEGDEDFPTSFRILFDASVANHLPTDACAIAGSMLTRRLIAAV